MQFFKELGSLIERRWNDQNYDEKVFPSIAAQALTEASPEERVSPWEIIRWLFDGDDVPSQQDLPGSFGDPPVTLYGGRRFHIDVYFWLDGTTSIHQHAFCGAFQVLLGSSLHSQYRFRDRQQLNQHCMIGRVELESLELLEQGAVKKISPGEKYIHSLFHLDRPSATICARTYHTATGAPQYNYHKPWLAVDPFFKDPLAVKQAQSASMLLRARRPEADALLNDLMARSDFQTAFTLLDIAQSHMAGDPLEQSFGMGVGNERFQNLVGAARRRHGDFVDLILDVFEESKRQNDLVRRRGQITSPEHRFFLALLLNAPSRGGLLELVKQKFPERDPIETVLNWVDELATTRALGAVEPNVLGIRDYDEDYLLVLQCLLEGFSQGRTTATFEAESDPGSAAEMKDKSARLYHSIRESALFKSLFQDLPSTADGESDRNTQAAFI
jgi:hypothetical protein